MGGKREMYIASCSKAVTQIENILPSLHEDHRFTSSPTSASFNQEHTPLVDTAVSIRRTAREPTQESFQPIGHVALDMRPKENERLGLSPETEGGNIYWIATLYISWALQKGGLGGAAMRELEWLAAREPLKGVTAILDVVPMAFQTRDDVVEKVYLSQGNPVPAVSVNTGFPSSFWAPRRRECVGERPGLGSGVDGDGGVSSWGCGLCVGVSVFVCVALETIWYPILTQPAPSHN